MGVDDKAVEAKRMQTAPLAVGQKLADCLEGKGVETDAECDTLAEEAATKLGVKFADIKSQVDTVASKRRRGEEVVMAKRKSVDVVTEYDGACEAGKDTSVREQVKTATDAAGSGEPRVVMGPYTDTAEKCRTVYNSTMRDRPDAEVETGKPDPQSRNLCAEPSQAFFLGNCIC